jgi:hypothetical protein
MVVWDMDMCLSPWDPSWREAKSVG